MAKGDVTLKFDANTGAYVQNILKAREAYEANADGARKMADTVSKAGDQMEDAFKKSGKAANEMAGVVGEAGQAAASSLGLVTSVAGGVAAAVGLILSGIDHKIHETEERAEKYINRARSLTESLAGSGQIGSADSVAANIKAMAGEKFAGGRQFSEQEITQAFAGISDQLGAKASVADKEAATRAAMQGRGTGLSEQRAMDVGVNFARFAEHRQPGQTDDDLYAESLKAAVLLQGAISERQLRTLNKFRDRGQGLKLIEAAAQSESGPRLIGQLEGEAEKPVSDVEVLELQKKLTAAHKGNKAAEAVSPEDHAAAVKAVSVLPARERSEVHKMRLGADKFTPEDARKLRLSKIAPDDRLAAMLADPTLAAPEQQPEIENLKRAAEKLPQISPAAAAQSFAASKVAEPVVQAGQTTSFGQGTEASTGQMDAEIEEVRALKASLFVRRHPILENVVPTWLQKRIIDPTHPEEDPQSGHGNEQLSPDQLRAIELKTLRDARDRENSPGGAKLTSAETGQATSHPEANLQIQQQQLAATQTVASILQSMHETLKKPAAPSKYSTTDAFEKPTRNSGLLSSNWGQQ